MNADFTLTGIGYRRAVSHAWQAFCALVPNVRMQTAYAIVLMCVRINFAMLITMLWLLAIRYDGGYVVVSITTLVVYSIAAYPRDTFNRFWLRYRNVSL